MRIGYDYPAIGSYSAVSFIPGVVAASASTTAARIYSRNAVIVTRTAVSSVPSSVRTGSPGLIYGIRPVVCVTGPGSAAPADVPARVYAVPALVGGDPAAGCVRGTTESRPAGIRASAVTGIRSDDYRCIPTGIVGKRRSSTGKAIQPYTLVRAPRPNR